MHVQRILMWADRERMAGGRGVSIECSWSDIRVRSKLLSGYYLISCMALCANASVTFAGDIDHIQVTEQDGVYHINVRADLSAPPDYVRQVLTDYPHLYRISNSIIESEVLVSDKDSALVRSKVLCCTALFCREVERVEEVSVLLSGDVESTVVPEYSEFKSGRAVWKITDKGNMTELEYTAYFEPDFFIPPLLGTRLVKQQMHDEFMHAFYQVERIAAINYEREWQQDMMIAKSVPGNDYIPCDENNVSVAAE